MEYPQIYINSNEDIKKIYNKIDNLNYGNNRQLLHKIRTAYSIDGNIGIEKPIGMKGNRLIAGFNLITADKNSINNFIKCFSIYSKFIFFFSS